MQSYAEVERKVLGKVAKLAGKDGFAFDSRIPAKYLAGVCARYGLMLARGALRAGRNGRIERPCFIGGGVRLRDKRNLHTGRNVQIRDGVTIDALSSDGVYIGAGSIIGEGSRIECTGTLRELGLGFWMGERSSFGAECFFGAAGGIAIGDDVIAGQRVRFHSENHNCSDATDLIKNQGVTRCGIFVGNNCWIGAGAVFLDGSGIGDGCVVAANAVVTKVFPDNVIIAGIPARVLQKRD